MTPFMTEDNTRSEQYPEPITASPEEMASLARMFDASQRLVVFTGAGISTESGIPDYRGPNGVWQRNAIPHVDTQPTGDAARFQMWEFRRKNYPQMQAKQPNSGHRIIAQLELDGKLLGIITQNIDGLHQKAGNSPERVIELHGSTHRLRCRVCGTEFDGAVIQARLDAGEEDPRCTVCGGPLRTAAVLFGESLPQDALRQAVALAQATDFLLVVGSSLAVNPAARMPQIAQQQGARIAIINREPTPLDPIADLVIHANAGSTLSGAYALMTEHSEVAGQ
jgi:NAD-dependent deacetylase